MYLALGPCDVHVSMTFFLALPVALMRFASRRLSLSSAPLCSSHARPQLLTHLLPLPETVVGLVKLLPGGNVVLAVETREVGHAVHRVSGRGPVLRSHGRGRMAGAAIRAGSRK